MSNIIVIAGKGGTGKTTIAALIVLMLARKKRGAVLAIDADPNSNLADALGIKSVSSVADVVDSISKDPDIVPKSMGKDSFIELQISKDIAEGDGYDLLVMGRPEGPGCYCYINNVLRNITAKLIKDYSFVVVDNEAGMEHFSRKTTRECNELIVVSDETQVGLKSARRIFALIEELGIVALRKFLVINRVSDNPEIELPEKEPGIEKIFSLPKEEYILKLSGLGESLSNLTQDSRVRGQIDNLGELICPRN